MLTRAEINALIALAMAAMVERHRYGPEFDHNFSMRVMPSDATLNMNAESPVLDSALAKLYALRGTTTE